jgi:hypothetical protein
VRSDDLQLFARQHRRIVTAYVCTKSVPTIICWMFCSAPVNTLLLALPSSLRGSGNNTSQPIRCAQIFTLVHLRPADRRAIDAYTASICGQKRRGMHRGSCLCGAVNLEVDGDLPRPDACHCSQCPKHSGHIFASTDVPRAALTVHGGDNVTWFRSSEKVRRGFCSTCGSSLFWDPIQRDWIGIAMGAFDLPTNTRLSIHVHVADKGDYYEIVDGLPQNQH